MAKESGESMKTGNSHGASDEARAIRDEIERTRGDMATTVNQIEERLSPAHIKEQIAEVTASVKTDIEQKVADLKESVIGGYHETKDHLKEDIGREYKDARHLVSDELTHARTAVRDATVGRVEHMVHDARESFEEASHSIVDTIKANPIPAALVGVGLGWLIFGARSAKHRSSPRLRGNANRFGYGYAGGDGYPERGDSRDFVERPRAALRQGQRVVGDAIHAVEAGTMSLGHRVQEGAGDLVHGAQHFAEEAGESVADFAQGAAHRVANAAGTAGHAAMDFAHDARDRGEMIARGAGRQFMRAEHGVENAFHDNPLAIGAIALAVGGAIGMMLPSTDLEDRWVGDAKDRFVDQAEHYAGDVIHRAEDAVGQLTSGEVNGKAKDGDGTQPRA